MPVDDTLDPDSLDDRLAPLFERTEELAKNDRRAVIEAGSELVDELLAVLRDRRLWDEEAPGGGYAPIHAADLLGAIGAREAIEPMYRVLASCDPDAILDTALTRALQAYGEEAVEPGIDLLTELPPSFRADLACVFAGLNVRRRDVFQILLKHFVSDPYLGAKNLAEYGDPEGLDALEPMLNRVLLEAFEEPARAEEAVAIADAIDDLGGELRDDQWEQVDQLREMIGAGRQLIEEIKAGEEEADHDHPDTFVREHDLGRNDDCWCGSGRKYKHCHWREDRRDH
ncbi:MAG: SEC-C domain-containing protein [Bradymonadaceae bacterium]